MPQPINIKDDNGAQVTITEDALDVNIINNGILFTLNEILSRIGNLSSAKGIVSDIRVTPLTTPNMSTLTTLTTLTNFGTSLPANTVGWSMQNINAVLSNINNVTL